MNIQTCHMSICKKSSGVIENDDMVVCHLRGCSQTP